MTELTNKILWSVSNKQRREQLESERDKIKELIEFTLTETVALIDQWHNIDHKNTEESNKIIKQILKRLNEYTNLEYFIAVINTKISSLKDKEFEDTINEVIKEGMFFHEHYMKKNEKVKRKKGAE